MEAAIVAAGSRKEQSLIPSTPYHLHKTSLCKWLAPLQFLLSFSLLSGIDDGVGGGEV